MEWLHALRDSGSTPALTAFVLGLLVALDGCTLATSITAIGYIARDLDDRRRAFWRGLLYALGRTVTYLLLAAIIIPLLRTGSSLAGVEHALSTYGGLILGPGLILVGLIMLIGKRLQLPTLRITALGQGLTHRKGWGSMLMGMLFALAICPTVGILYFGMLLPMASATAWGYGLLFIFAVTTALPVVIVAWLLAFSLTSVGAFYNRMRTVQRWLNWVVAILFIVAGMQQIWEHYEHHHETEGAHAHVVSAMSRGVVTEDSRAVFVTRVR